MTGQPIAVVLAGVLKDAAIELDEDTRVIDVVILMKTMDMSDGTVGFQVAQSEGLSWLEKAGMLSTADRVEGADLITVIDDEDD